MTEDQDAVRCERIRQLNDTARRSLSGTIVCVTAAVAGLGAEVNTVVLKRVRCYSDFGSNNDPYGEHDMGFFEVAGEAFFFKFDYYDLTMRAGSEDPSDASKTKRVLTIGLASDY